MMRGPRSPVIIPRAELTWSPVDGSNCAVLLTVDHCGWLNVLYVSVPSATLARSLMSRSGGFPARTQRYRLPGSLLPQLGRALN
jgi:hypothetical protein